VGDFGRELAWLGCQESGHRGLVRSEELSEVRRTAARIHNYAVFFVVKFCYYLMPKRKKNTKEKI
jgi:hypothetical protein